MTNQWRSESISHDEGDLFVAIVTTLGGKQLIAQCTTLEFAKEIEDKHNRFDVEIGHLKFSLAGARDRAEAAEARIAQLEAERDKSIADAVQAERYKCEWHINNAIKFYEKRIEWCNSHPGNDAAKITSQYARDSHAGVLAAIRSRGEVKE